MPDSPVQLSARPADSPVRTRFSRPGWTPRAHDASSQKQTRLLTLPPTKNRKPQRDSRPLNAHAVRYADAMFASLRCYFPNFSNISCICASSFSTFASRASFSAFSSSFSAFSSLMASMRTGASVAYSTVL